MSDIDLPSRAQSTPHSNTAFRVASRRRQHTWAHRRSPAYWTKYQQVPTGPPLHRPSTLGCKEVALASSFTAPKQQR